MNRRKLPVDIKYYVYAFLRPSGIPYYIGRGCNYRAWDRTNRAVKAPTDPKRVQIIKEYLSLEQSSELEKVLIDFWGRKNSEHGGVLANTQDGGLGGSPGRVIPKAQRERMRQVHLGRKQDPELVARRLKWAIDCGFKKTEKHKEAIKQGLREAHSVWWYHQDLGIYFYGCPKDVSDTFSNFFTTYKPKQDRCLRKGCSLCRNQLAAAWSGKRPPYKGWTRGFPPSRQCGTMIKEVPL